MCRKLIFLTSLVVLLTCLSMANALQELKVDLTVNRGGAEDGNSVDYTDKSKQSGFEDWTPWIRWSGDQEGHDATSYSDLGGTGLNAGLGMWRGGGPSSTVLDFTTFGEGDDPICNTWMRSRESEESSPEADAHLVLGGPGLIPGTYEVYGYHNTPDGSEAIMPRVYVETYDNNSIMGNSGVARDPDGGGVIPEINDVNVRVLHLSDDDDLLLDEPNRSYVRFYTDGSPVMITWEAGEGSTAVLNAFIIILPAGEAAGNPSPRSGAGNVCPDANLIWEPGTDANTHDVYFGTDWDDVNDANTTVDPNNVYQGNFDVNKFDPCGAGLLDFGMTYYWRVDEVNETDPNLWKGTVWSFTVESGQPYNPSPAISLGSIPTSGTTLSWTSSCLATQHDIYLSTKFEDVNDYNNNALLGTTYDSNTNIGTGSLYGEKRYYWRVKDTGTVTLPESDVWYFQTVGFPLMHYTFDGTLDANLPDPITDDTGNVTFDRVGTGELRYAQPNPTYNTLGTSAHFKQNGAGGYGQTASALFRSCFGPDLLDLDSSAYTIEAWVRHDGDANNTRGDIDMDGTIIRKERYSYGLGIDDDGTAKFMHSGDVIASESGRIEQGNWHHIAAVFNTSADANQFEKLYVDGLVVADNNSLDLNPSDDFSTDHVGIGAYRYQSPSASHIANHFYGAIDELRVIDIALTPPQFLIIGDANLAWLPRPYNGAQNVPYDTHLEWVAGEHANDVNGHDVFIGTSWNDINDVNRSNIGSYPNVDYNNVDANMEDLASFLELGQTYYWRVDEVNDSCDASPWKGNIWRFTVAEYIIIDDFEDYTEGSGSAHPIDDRWTQGYLTGIGGYITLGLPWNLAPVRGQQSMTYYYDNTETYYSETGTKSIDPCDFTHSGVKTLTLWFHGEYDEQYDHYNDANETEQLYVGLKDNDGDYAEVRYPMDDMDDIRLLEWTDWNIVIGDFEVNNPDINVTNIETLYIGFGDRDNTSQYGGWGYVYFDDIVLYPPTCIPSERPEWFKLLDFNGDCIVDFGDVAIMAADWLDADVNFPVVEEPCDANLVGWWKLDEGDGNTTADSSSNNNTGTLETNDVDVFWVTTGHDGNALDFDGGRVRIPDTQDLRLTGDVSLSAWIKFSDSQNSARVVVKGADNREAYGLEVDDDSQLVFYVREDPNDPCVDDYDRYSVSSDDLDQGEWTHIAGTFDGDGNTVKCYINGVLKGSEDANVTYILSQDTNDLAIGNRSDDDDREFEGIIDDVRVYDYALSAVEVAWLASDGTGIVSVQSIAELIYDEAPGKKAVNFRDLAELGKKENWFAERLYP